MKNYKSWLAFMTFLGAYIYALVSDKSNLIVDTTGYLLLVSTAMMMVRNEILGQFVLGLSELLRERIK